MRHLLAAAACLAAPTAHAQFSESFNGVPDVYSAAELTDWSLVTPVNAAAPTWRPSASTGVAAIDPSNCNIITNYIEADAATIEGLLGQFTVMTGEAYGAFMQEGFDATADGYAVSDVTQPVRVTEDGLPGMSATYTLTRTADGLKTRLVFNQIFTSGAFVTTTCGTLPAYFDARRTLFAGFVDDLVFLNGARNVADVLNARGRAALGGPAPTLASSDPLQSALRADALAGALAAASGNDL